MERRLKRVSWIDLERQKKMMMIARKLVSDPPRCLTSFRQVVSAGLQTALKKKKVMQW